MECHSSWRILAFCGELRLSDLRFGIFGYLAMEVCRKGDIQEYTQGTRGRLVVIADVQGVS